MGWAILKLSKTINGNTISTTLKELGQSGAHKLQMLLLLKNAQWLHKNGLESITLDADSTVKSVCVNQEGAEKGFNTRKKGAKSYHPLLVFVIEMKLLYHPWFRTGSAYTSNSIVDFLREVQSSLPGNVRKVFFRADSGFFSGKLFDLLESFSWGYLVKVKLKNLERDQYKTCFDWFILVPAKITRNGYQIEIKMYEHHFYKKAWEELDKLIEAA